jgi:prepilin-type N-terminal cleavage/methylation domain-containing protein
MRDTRYKNGFTFVELLVALMVTSIIFAAVATLAYALGTAYDATNDIAEKQAQVRYASIRISELIRQCKLICGTSGYDIAVWRADDNGDGKINPKELVYLDAGPDRNYIQLLDFPSADNWQVTLSSILSGTAKQELILICDERQTALVPECSDVQIVLNPPPPWSKSVSVSFDLIENRVIHQYQIIAALRGWAGHLLNEAGDAIVSDDD